MERIARILLGAASGGVLGLMVAGLLRLGVWGLGASMAGLGAAVAVANARLQRQGPAAGRLTATGGALAGTALAAGLVTLWAQAVYVNVKGNPPVPLPIWPVIAKVLWVVGASATMGILTSLVGWRRDGSGSGRLAMLGVLAGLATFAVAMVCFLSGYGFPLGR